MSQIVSRIAEAVSEYLTDPSRTHLFDAISIYNTVEQANEGLHRLTGIRGFFPDGEAFEELQRLLLSSTPTVGDRRNREWGDFQTPPGLASQVCRCLLETGISPRIIIEPTYGTGNFIFAALRSFPKAGLVYGVEVQDRYEWHFKLALLMQILRDRRPSAEIELHQDDIFTHRFPEEVLGAQEVLIIGNPPWVTNAELGALGASNLPSKRNIKALNGLDAMTGKSNFDIGEFILLRMLELFSERRGTLAMLCKNSVVKNIVEALPQRKFKVSNIRAYGIDANREFGASVEASLLFMTMGASSPTFSCQATSFNNPEQVIRTFGWTRDRFVSNVENYEKTCEFDGESPMVWRQGLKHDCVKVMELDDAEGNLVNQNGEIVEVEERWLYWLLKSSDIRTFEVDRARKKVVVTQRHIGADTSHLQVDAPKLWTYLLKNSEYLERRKSSIYRGMPPFSIFGIGEYSFKPYKVAISGLYKQPYFSLVLPIDNRPVMLDDTCYFLGFDSYLNGLFTASILNSSEVQRFLQSVVFSDAKRPYTKEVLMRIDLLQVVVRLSFQILRDFWKSIGYRPKVLVKESDFEVYSQLLTGMRKGQQASQMSLSL